MKDFITFNDLDEIFKTNGLHINVMQLGRGIGGLTNTLLDLINHKITIEKFSELIANAYDDFDEMQELEKINETKRTPIIGHIYLMKNWRNFHIKIGFTKNKPQHREQTLQSQEPEVELLFSSYGWTKEKEQELHDHYKADKVRGEWFNLDQENIDQIIGFVSNEQTEHEFNTHSNDGEEL